MTAAHSAPQLSALCTYCGIPRHTVDKCYKKERADKMTGKAPAHPPTAMRSPSAYLTDGEKDVKSVHLEGAFMALAEHRTTSLIESELPQLAEAAELPSIVNISGFSFYFSDPSNAIRYLGLCCGASMHIVRSLVSRGRFFAELYLCDKDPTARKVALATLQQLADSNPDSFAPSLRAIIQSGRLFAQIPQDVTKIDATSI